MNGDIDGLTRQLREGLEKAVKKKACRGILFSGGLDTAVLAHILATIEPDIVAVTVVLEPSGPDLPYAQLMVKRLGLRHHVVTVPTEEAIAAIPDAIRTLGSFDPVLPNDLAVLFGMDAMRRMGLDAAVTGDGADELLGGYDFMKTMDDVEAYIARIAPQMTFSSNMIGKALGLEVIQPFLDPDFITFALGLDSDVKIREERGEVMGKWLLRKAFEGLLPQEIVWQGKRPLETGSGMDRLRTILSERIRDDEFEDASRSMHFISKEHLYYYRIYRQVVGEVPQPLEDEKPCPACGAGMKPDAFHCRVCGNVLDWRSS